jgi:8-oxo-dGTP diphosphatase
VTPSFRVCEIPGGFTSAELLSAVNVDARWVFPQPFPVFPRTARAIHRLSHCVSQDVTCLISKTVGGSAEQLGIPIAWLRDGSARHSVVVDVHALLTLNGSVLLGRRHSSGFADGRFHLPAGHLEPGESALSTLVRECWEELGVLVLPGGVDLAHVMHQSSGGGRIGLFFWVREWEGKIRNREPDKCSELRWVPLAAPPRRTVPYARAALEAIAAGEAFSLFGWAVQVGSHDQHLQAWSWKEELAGGQNARRA